MKKKFLALTLALVMCLSLAVPVFAAERPGKEDEGIAGSCTLTRSGTDAGQFVEKTIKLGYFGSENYEDIIQGYQPITADAAWTFTNTSKDPNTYSGIVITPYENLWDGERYDAIAMDDAYLRRDGSFVLGIRAYEDPDTAELINVHPGQSVTFKLADAMECLGRDASEDVIYCVHIWQEHSDSDKYEDAYYYYKVGSQSPEPADPSAQYTDLVPGAWYKDAVNYVLTNKLFQGMTDTIFAPDATMNRAMFVVVLARRDGVSDESGATWYEKDVQWAVSKGYYDGKDPEGGISRQEMALMLYRHAGSPKVSGSLDGFTDASSVSASVRDAMIWAVQNGYIKGMGSNELNPAGTSTRAQVATIFMRVFG